MSTLRRFIGVVAAMLSVAAGLTLSTPNTAYADTVIGTSCGEKHHMSPEHYEMAGSAGPCGVGIVATAAPAAVVSPADFVTSTASVASPSEVAKTYVVRVKCHLVKYGVGNAGYIYGTGSGNNIHTARGNALRDADRSVPQGHYKRHCKVIP